MPLSQYFGGSWAIGLGFWLVPALIAALFWFPQAREVHSAHRDVYRVRGLLRDRLAWQVTLYMGLQSSLSYIVFGWLPSILIGRGLTPTEAGLLLSGSIIVQVISALSAPWLATRGKDQRLAIMLVMSLTLTGLFGCLYAPSKGCGAGRFCSGWGRAVHSVWHWR